MLNWFRRKPKISAPAPKLSSSYQPLTALPESFLALSSPAEQAAFRFLFSAKNPFFAQGQAFVTSTEGARVAGFYPGDLEISGKRIAFFGTWSTNESFEANSKIFQEVEVWAKALGAKALYGPIDFSTFNRYRLQITHYGEGETFTQEPTNPEYYVEYLKRLGFKVDQEYQTFRSRNIEALRVLLSKLAGNAFQKSEEYRFVAITREYLQAKKSALRDAVNDMFSDNFAFVPIDEPLFSLAFGDSFVTSIDAPTSFVVESASGQVAAICICYRGGENQQTLFIKTVGIVKAFRGKGISLVNLIQRILSEASNVEKVALCLMKKSNFPSMLMGDLVQEEKLYGLFKKDL